MLFWADFNPNVPPGPLAALFQQIRSVVGGLYLASDSVRKASL